MAARHPEAPAVECRAKHTPYVTAELYRIGGAGEKLATFGSLDPTGNCELAIRNARGGVMCMPQGSTVKAVRVATGEVVKTYGSQSSAVYKQCFQEVNRDQLATRAGYVDFIDPAGLAAWRERLPAVDDPALEAILSSPRTMWYDERAMTFTYQDSEGDPKGLRANRVGYDTGINSTVPDIRKLVEYFDPEQFKSPFKTAAGTDQVPNDMKYMLNFWHAPQANGQTLPVRYWMQGARWRWTFPIGTVFGEVLFQRAPDDGTWHPFEIRTRTRYQAGWDVAVFRPFRTAQELADRVRSLEPAWDEKPAVRDVLDHLESSSTLTPHAIEGRAYRVIFQPITGGLDYVPDFRDNALVKRLLAETPFKSVEGYIWKEGGGLETYAPSTKAPFSIVPRDYEAGVIAVNEVSCDRCHSHTGRPLGQLDGRIVLYGEMWGEDRIFTWHLFEIAPDSFTVSDNSRRVNPRLVQAGLVRQGRPAASESAYGTPLGH